MAVLNHTPETEQARRERLRQSEPVRGLCRALRLVDGFALYLITVERSSDVDLLLERVTEAMAARALPVRWRHVQPSGTDEQVAARLEHGILDPLVEERATPPDAGEVVVLHAEQMRPADRAEWAELFNRMNRARNLIIPRVSTPLVLLLHRDGEALFAQSAPDFWSLRSEAWRVDSSAQPEATPDAFLDPYDFAARLRDASARVLDPYDFAARLRDASARVCRVRLNERAAATGFLVGPDLVLTMCHALRDHIEGQSPPQGIDVVFDDGTLAAERFRLAADWIVDSSPPSHADYNLGEGDSAADELDHALIRLAAPAGASRTRDGAKRGWFTLRRLSPSVGGFLSILQFHGSGPLRIAFDVASVLGFNANHTRVRHRTNTMSGSAGAPCLDAEWNVVAMHHGFPTAVYNQAVPMAAIHDLLRSRGKLDEIERYARVAQE